MHLVSNERTKLLAAFLNTCAAAMLTTWVVAPAAAFLYGGIQPTNLWPFFLGVPFGITGALMFHVAAQIVLSRLRE